MCDKIKGVKVWLHLNSFYFMCIRRIIHKEVAYGEKSDSNHFV